MHMYHQGRKKIFSLLRFQRRFLGFLPRRRRWLRIFSPSPRFLFLFDGFVCGSFAYPWSSGRRRYGLSRLKIASSSHKLISSSGYPVDWSSLLCSEIQKLTQKPSQDLISHFWDRWDSGGSRSRFGGSSSLWGLERPHYCSFPWSLPVSVQDIRRFESGLG